MQTVIQAEIERQRTIIARAAVALYTAETVADHYANVSTSARAEHTIAVLELLLPKEEEQLVTFAAGYQKEIVNDPFKMSPRTFFAQQFKNE